MVLLVAAGALALFGQAVLPSARGASTEKPKVPEKTQTQKQEKKASDLIHEQEPPKVNPRVLEQATPANVAVVISLGKQRAYLMVGEEVAVDTPISSGKRAGMTPKGTFKIVEKNPDYRSSLYGNFVNSQTGETVRTGVSTRIDPAPSGTVYKSMPMRWFMRFGDAKGPRPEGMHAGILPGYPAAHGCVRLPEDIAKLFYNNVVKGTSVTISD